MHFKPQQESYPSAGVLWKEASPDSYSQDPVGGPAPPAAEDSILTLSPFLLENQVGRQNVIGAVVEVSLVEGVSSLDGERRCAHRLTSCQFREVRMPSYSSQERLGRLCEKSVCWVYLLSLMTSKDTRLKIRNLFLILLLTVIQGLRRQ